MKEEKFMGTKILKLFILACVSMLLLSISPGDIGAQGAEPIKIGFISMFTGRVSELGISGFGGLEMAASEINEKGGLLGRKIELVRRDCAGKPEEAVRLARELVTKDKVEFIIDNSSSAISFALKEVSKDLKVITFITSPEAVRLNADPTIWSKYTFKSSRSVLHDAVVAGAFASKVSKKQNLKKWATIAPSYSYGQDWVELFLIVLKDKSPDLQIGSQLWPKVFSEDFTPHVTTVISEKPDALFVVQWGPDAIAFVKAAKQYRLSSLVKLFGVNFGEYAFLNAVQPVPSGMYAGNRYLLNAPPTEENKAFGMAYNSKFKSMPTCWSQEVYTGVKLLEEAIRKAGTTETEAVIKALEGLTIKAPWGTPPNGTVTMRARDHQIINYYISWGITVQEEPFVVDNETVAWDEILSFEEKYLKEKGWLK